MTKPQHPFGDQTADRSTRRTATLIRPSVRWTDGAGSHERRIDRPMTAGAAPGVDLVVSAPAVSRLHAELEPRPDGLWVRDLGSKNGTWVQGVLVERARVPEGGRVVLGDTTMVVDYARVEETEPLWPSDTLGDLRGSSVTMRRLFAKIARIAALDSTVLIHGETGTGKELVAQAIHALSPRRGRPFVVLDCGAVPEHLFEAELFGHAKGAFTGAAQARAGAIEEADEGTLFLDEIGELPLSVQPKLLRALESRSIRRVGENEPRAVDTRFVAATHRDLRTLVNAGTFREDLYFRLAVMWIDVPPLRDRLEDIPVLLDQFAPDLPASVSREALVARLMARTFPGNVRELKNYLERVRALGHANVTESEQGLPRASSSGSPLPEVPLDRPMKEIRDEWLTHLERSYVRGLLQRHRYSITDAAKAAGLDRSYMHRLIKKHGL